MKFVGYCCFLRRLKWIPLLAVRSRWQSSALENAKLINVPLNRLYKISKTNVLICAVRRKDVLIIPDGNTVLEQGDRIHVMGQHRDLVRFCHDINLFDKKQNE